MSDRVNGMLGTILVADNDPSFAKAFSQMLEMRSYQAMPASDPTAVTEHVRKKTFDLLTLDLDWGRDDLDGLELLRRVLEIDPLLPVVMITEHSSIPTAIEATRRGAFNYIEKMTDREAMFVTIRNAIESGRLKRERHTLLTEQREKYHIVGNSIGLMHVRDQIQKAGPTDSVVFITGESGTGKELVARQVHYASSRSDRKFVSVDAGTLADSLAESELFGHKKGAFTGALVDRRGLVEEAEGGTLFLDEITNASLGLQARLLHLIQEREFRRVGENELRKGNIRIIAASNQHLPSLIDQGRFRADLYFRLKVIDITIPPLRQRKDDIPQLARHFVSLKSKQSFGRERFLSPEASTRLLDYDWPGNVRELENAIERIVVLSESDPIEVDDVETILGNLWMGKSASIKSLSEMTREFKRDCIIKAINLAEGRITAAAELLQIDRTHLHKLINEYQLKDLDK